MDVFSDKFMKVALSHATYYILLLVFLAWLLSLISFFEDSRSNLKNFVKNRWPGLLCALAMSAVVFGSVQTYPRVLSDETNILSVSRSMAFERRVENTVEGRMGSINYQSLRRTEEKRPYLTPFFYHLAHITLGYDPRNAFVVNFIALALLYFLVYALVASAYGTGWGIAGILFAASQPILSISAASTGIDFLNTVFILIAFMSLREYLKAPSAPKFLFLWMNLVMLAHARYESAIFFGVVLAGLMLLKRIRLDYFRSSWSYWLTPVFLAPVIYQRIAKWNDKELPGESVSTAFKLGDLYHHNVVFLKLLVNRDFFIPIAVAVNLAAVIGLLYFTVRFFVKKDVLRDPAERASAFLFLAPLAFLWVLTTAYYFGRIDNPVSVRLFMTYLVFFSVVTTVFFAHLFARLGMDARHGFILGLAAFIAYHPVAVKDNFSTAISAGREHRHVLKFLESQPDKRFLIISPYSNLFTPYLYSSIGFERVNHRPNRVLRQYKERLFREIIVVQMVDQKTGAIKAGMTLPKKFKLKTLSELMLRPDEYVRISRVVNPR